METKAAMISLELMTKAIDAIRSEQMMIKLNENCETMNRVEDQQFQKVVSDVRSSIDTMGSTVDIFESLLRAISDKNYPDCENAMINKIIDAVKSTEEIINDILNKPYSVVRSLKASNVPFVSPPVRHLDTSKTVTDDWHGESSHYILQMKALGFLSAVKEVDSKLVEQKFYWRSEGKYVHWFSTDIPNDKMFLMNPAGILGMHGIPLKINRIENKSHRYFRAETLKNVFDDPFKNVESFFRLDPITKTYWLQFPFDWYNSVDSMLMDLAGSLPLIKQHKKITKTVYYDMKKSVFEDALKLKSCFKQLNQYIEHLKTLSQINVRPKPMVREVVDNPASIEYRKRVAIEAFGSNSCFNQKFKVLVVSDSCDNTVLNRSLPIDSTQLITLQGACIQQPHPKLPNARDFFLPEHESDPNFERMMQEATHLIWNLGHNDISSAPKRHRKQLTVDEAADHMCRLMRDTQRRYPMLSQIFIQPAPCKARWPVRNDSEICSTIWDSRNLCFLVGEIMENYEAELDLTGYFSAVEWPKTCESTSDFLCYLLRKIQVGEFTPCGWHDAMGVSRTFSKSMKVRQSRCSSTCDFCSC